MVGAWVLQMLQVYNDVVGEDGTIHWGVPYSEWPVRETSALRIIRATYSELREKDREKRERRTRARTRGSGRG